MDLLNAYDNEDSQSSSSSDDKPNIKTENAPPEIKFATEKPTSSGVCGFDALGKVSLDQLMDAKAKLAAEQSKKRREETLTPALKDLCLDIDKEIRMYLGSIKVLQKHTILSSMDRFISKFVKDHKKFNKPGVADFFANFIRTCMHIYKYLLRSHELGKRYYKRVIKILAIYTDLELYASLRGNEYDRTVADRISLVYQTYLDDTNNLMALDVLMHSKRLCRLHRGILVLLFEHFLVPKTSTDHPDILFMKYLMLYKKWIFIEQLDCQKICNAFKKFIKPRITICMNSIFKPYLPVDGEGFVTIDNIDDILNMEYSLTDLCKCIRKAEERSLPTTKEQVGEVIVLTDDEPEPEHEDDSFSNPGTSSMTSSHNDEMSNDFDWHSASSMFGTRSSTSQNIIETVSIDSPTSLRKSSSDSSFGDFNWKMDGAESTTETKSLDGVEHMEEQSISMEIAIDDKAKPKLNGDTSPNLSTLDESLFNRLVKDINSTHLSLPSNGSVSSEVEIIQNGNQSQTDEEDTTQHKMKTNENNIISNNSTNQVPVVCDVLDKFNNDTVIFGTVHPIENGETESSGDESSNQQAAVEIAANHLNTDGRLDEHCDNEVNTILKGHEETLKNIEEILTDDLKQPTVIPNGGEPSTEKLIQIVQTVPQKIFVDTACSPLIFEEEEEEGEEEEEEEEEEQKEKEVENEKLVNEPVVESIVDEPVNEDIGGAQNEILNEPTGELVVNVATSEPVEDRLQEPIPPMLIDIVQSEEFVEPIEIRNPVEKTVDEPPAETGHAGDLTIETGVVHEVAKEPQDWVPATESTVSVFTETSLLTKSEQDILFKDRESGELFSELFSNGPPPPVNDDIEKSSEDTLSQITNDSPLTFLVNGLDPNFKLKTYSRKNRKPRIETKTISTQTIATQTCSPPQSAPSSPVTTIDDSKKTDKEILTDETDVIADVDEDEKFLSDIFDSTDLQVRIGNISRVHSPKSYFSSTPASKPLRTYAARRSANKLTPPPLARSMAPTTEGIVFTVKPIEKPVEESRKLGKIAPSLLAPIKNQKPATESPPIVIKRKRGRPRKYPLPTPQTTGVPQTAVEQPKKEPKKRGRKPKPKEPMPPPTFGPAVERPRRLRAKRISIFQDVFKIQSPRLRRLTISRRLSKVFSLADQPKLATILRRLTYNKSINTSRSFTNKNNCDSILSGSSILYSSAYRLNGQKKASDSIATNKETTVQTNEPKEATASSMFLTPSNQTQLPTKPSRPTILERKTYLKSNQTSSPIVPSALKFSPHSAKLNHSSPLRIRHFNRAQRYSRIDLITCQARRRDRKKSVKNINPRVVVKRIDLNSFKNLNVSKIAKISIDDSKTETNATVVNNANDVQNSTPLVVDLTDDDEMQLSFFGPSMNSTTEMSDFNSMHANKRRHSPSNDTETDMTNELTTDQESNVEDGDDSTTRKSKRSRKRPKILDL